MTDDRAIMEQLFAGGGKMGALMRSLDWSQTSLGEPEQWSQSLKTAIRITLTSRHPMFVWWGEELINLYNDAYSFFLHTKHPMALGQPASCVWQEIWDQLEPRVESARRKNEGTFDESLLFIMLRKGYPEETYVTFSYSPIPDDHGGTGGIFCACTDDTQRIVGERQLALLRELAARTADARTLDEACTLSASSLETDPYDLPFAMIYLIHPERQQIFLAAAASIDRDHPALPQTVAFDADSVWQLAEVVKTQKTCLINDLGASFNNLPTGAWQQIPYQAVAVPIASSGQTGKAGVLVAGLNPFRLFDADYRGFIDLIVGQISASIANADAYEAERKRAEALAELDQAKTTFFSNVSHEFRTPLTLMLGPLGDVLADPTGPNSSDRQQLEVAYRNSQRLLKLVNTLLDFSRIEAGRIEVVYEPTDLAMLTADLAGVFRSAIERVGLRLRVDCSPLPEPAYVDREMWEKIVLNLLSNAFKFTFKGEIAVVLRSGDNDITLEVRDMGIGIPASELPHIFERFYRVKQAKGRSYEGTGIGLSLIQELVRLHGGTIRVNSVVDRGTSFTVSIPKGCAHLPSDRIGTTRTLPSTAMRAAIYFEESLRWLPEARSEEFPNPHEVGIRGMENRDNHTTSIPSPTRILLVDDNADMRDYLKRLLSQYYEVKSVADGVAALTAARQQLPDLVLTDVMMPGLDGFGLLRELRTDLQTRELPIILLSARAGEEARVEGLKAGADDYLIKPFSARELLASVESNLKLARLRQEAANRERELRRVGEAAQRRAQAAETSLENVLASINDQFLVLDREWRYTYVNDRVVEVVGLSREELLGQCVWDVYPDTVGSRLYTEFHRAMVERTVVQFEYFYPAWQRWFELRVYPAVEGLSVLVTEITERKRVEDERKQAEELHRQLQHERDEAWARLQLQFERMPIACIISDPQMQIIDWNPAAERIFGYRREEVVGMNSFHLLVPPSSGAHVQEINDRLASGGVTAHTFNENVTKDGHIIVCEWHNTPLQNAEGEFVAVLAMAQDITERKRTEEALRESEERFRVIVNQVTVGIAQCDLTGRFLLVNKKFCAITGYPKEELLQKGILDITHPDYLSLGSELFQRLVTEGADFIVEKRYVRKDGSEIWVNNSLSPVRNASGQVQYAVVVVLDISDRKRAEIALQKSEAKFRTVFDQMYQFLGLLTPEGLLQEVNQNALTFAQVEREALIGKPLWEFPSWKAITELVKTAKTAVAQAAAGDVFLTKMTFPNPKGEPCTFDLSITPIYANDGEQILWLLVEGRDITPLVHLQEDLRQEQKRSLQLINSSVDGIVAFDAEGCCTLWNPAMEELTGVSSQEAMGKYGQQVFATLLNAPTLRDFHFGTAVTLSSFDFVFIHPHTRHSLWIEARYAPLHNGSDLPQGGLMMVRDVSKQRELERMKREFISIISHEIRTPLSSIRGALGLVAEGILDDEPEAAKEMLGIANNNIERLVRLVNDILALNRLESEQVKLKPQWCDAAALVQQAFSNVQDLAAANRITLYSSISNVSIWADPDWLVQVLVNLVNNAVKFSPSDTSVAVAVQTRPQEVYFQVTDRGRGIPAEKLESIFNRFQQVDASDARQKGGTGLGLAICRLIVQLHGGQIWAESELGQSSTFYFTLPFPNSSHS